MTTIEIIILVLLVVGVVLALITHLGWSIATQDRDHDVAASGPVPRRRFWTRHRRTDAGPVNEVLTGDREPGPTRN